MGNNAIYLPGVAMVTLTFVVWWRMYFLRIGQMRRERIHPQAVATSAQVSVKLTDSRAADNFRNLFELPVLFYLALAVAAQAELASTLTLSLAWLFVVLRIVHSYIQCTYNKVMHRFYVYLTGGLVLFGLWGVLAYELLQE